jgi:hypothetical protein
MYTITINGDTLNELFANLEKLISMNKGAAETVSQTAPAAQPLIVNPTQPPAPAAQQAKYPASQPPSAVPIPQAAPPVPTVAAAPAAPVQTYTTPTPATPADSPMPAVPASAPVYTLDALARAGAALIEQSGKMPEALALLARYGVQTVNRLKPEQYGAFAAELRALGAQI